MILLWGVPGDSPLDEVLAALRKTIAPVRLLDQRQNTEMVFNVEIQSDGTISGRIIDESGAIDLADVRAAYIRPLESGKAANLEAIDDPAYGRAISTDMSLLVWADRSRTAVVNRPASMAANHSKPYQSCLISRYGFAVPDTLITTDAETARDFVQRHGCVIYKSISGLRSIVARLSAGDLGGLSDVANCPTQFQQYIAGRDVRVHVIGDRLIATEIASGADDYRYASRVSEDVAMAAIELPSDIAEQCRVMASGMGLHFAGIDLRRTPGDEWYCFEVNPSPGFTYYEAGTGQPIAEAVADLLIGLAERQ
jgi:glutathione synthase/RimK-type ligase-like ATP-grasp enzyme